MAKAINKSTKDPLVNSGLYIKLGRLKKSIADKINRKCADIYISKNHIKHIESKHSKELNKLGVTAIDYVTLIANHFNQIRIGSNNSLLIIIYKENKSDVAAININYSIKKGFWEVKTAQPRRNSEIEEKTLLW